MASVVGTKTFPYIGTKRKNILKILKPMKLRNIRL